MALPFFITDLLFKLKLNKFDQFIPFEVPFLKQQYFKDDIAYLATLINTRDDSNNWNVIHLDPNANPSVDQTCPVFESIDFLTDYLYIYITNFFAQLIYGCQR